MGGRWERTLWMGRTQERATGSASSTTPVSRPRRTSVQGVGVVSETLINALRMQISQCMTYFPS